MLMAKKKILINFEKIYTNQVRYNKYFFLPIFFYKLNFKIKKYF